MPTCTLTFMPAINFNTSLQIGDIVYYCPQVMMGGFQTAEPIGGANDSSKIIKIGPLTSIEGSQPMGTSTASKLHCDMDISVTPPGATDFIMFSKDNKANLSSILGYYAEVEFRNDSATEAELFSVSSEISKSSK